MTIEMYIKGEELQPAPLHYTDCGLDNVYLKNGFCFEQIQGEPAMSITNMDGLHEAIAMNIVLSRKAPNGKELRFLRSELDMTQAELANTLSISDQTVARWEKGEREASGTSVFSLKIVYLLSRVPEDEKLQLMNQILEKLKALSDSDETSSVVELSYHDDKWEPTVLAAA